MQWLRLSTWLLIPSDQKSRSKSKLQRLKMVTEGDRSLWRLSLSCETSKQALQPQSSKYSDLFRSVSSAVHVDSRIFFSLEQIFVQARTTVLKFAWNSHSPSRTILIACGLLRSCLRSNLLSIGQERERSVSDSFTSCFSFAKAGSKLFVRSYAARQTTRRQRR